MKLPNIVKIPKKVRNDKQYNAISDYLSDTFGFCVKSFRLKNGFAIKIKWDIS